MPITRWLIGAGGNSTQANKYYYALVGAEATSPYGMYSIYQSPSLCIVLSDDSIVLSGYSSPIYNSTNRGYLVKIDKDATSIIWQSALSYGSNNSGWPCAVTKDSSNNIYALGVRNSGSSNRQVFACKINNSDGTSSVIGTAYDPPSGYFFENNYLTFGYTSQGLFGVGGYQQSGIDTGVMAIQFDLSTMNITVARQTYYDPSLALGMHGGHVAQNTFYTLPVRYNGNPQLGIQSYTASGSTWTANWGSTWTNPYGYTDYAEAVAANSANTVLYMGGITQGWTNGNPGTRALLIMKINPSTGATIWTRLNTDGTSTTPAYNCMAVDSSDNIYYAFTWSEARAFHLIKYNSSGTLQYHLLFQWNTNWAQIASGGIRFDSTGNLIMDGVGTLSTQTYPQRLIMRYPNDGSKIGTYGDLTISNVTGWTSSSYTISASGLSTTTINKSFSAAGSSASVTNSGNRVIFTKQSF